MWSKQNSVTRLLTPGFSPSFLSSLCYPPLLIKPHLLAVSGSLIKDICLHVIMIGLGCY
jgi:hypothetical protein